MMKINKFLVLPLLTFLGVLLLGISAMLYVRAQNQQKLEIQAKVMAEQVGIRLQDFLKTRISRLDFFREQMEVQTDLTESEFRAKALLIQAELPGFQAINWIDRDGYIRWVTPLNPNRAAVGASILNKAASAAGESYSRALLYKIDTATPPINLIQGGLGYATYLPIVVEENIVGTINGVFRLEQLITECFRNTVHDFNYRVVLAGEAVYQRGEEDNFQTSPFLRRYNFNLLGQAWELQIVPGSKDSEIGTAATFIHIAIVALSLLTALFVRQQMGSKAQIEQALKDVAESESKFKTIFDHSPACLLRFNQQGTFTNWNRQAASLFNFEFPPATNRRISDLSELNPLQSTVEEAQKGKESTYKGFLTIQGAKLEVEASCEPMIMPDGEHNGGVLLLQDVTSRGETIRMTKVMYEISNLTTTNHDLTEMLHSIKEVLNSVLDTSNFFVALYDDDTGEVSYPYYADEFDSAPPEPSKEERGLTAFVLRNAVPVILTKQEIYDLNNAGEIELLGTPSEQWLGSPLLVEGEPIGVMAVQSYSKDVKFDGSDMGMMNFVSDQVALTIKIKIEDEKLRQSELMHRELSEKLNDSNNIKALLLDIITHDLKNPAGVISAVTDMLVQGEEIPDEILLIKDSSDALLKVIENTSSLAKISIGEKISLQQVDISNLAKTITQEFKASFDGLGKPLEINIDDGMHCQANPVIAEVFRNYLSNALKYAPEGKKIVFSLEDSGDEIGLYVADLGNPIEGDDRTNIFERSVQLENGISRGSGLGLAIVKRIADVHNASVGVYANEPTGNVFFMRLPKIAAAGSQSEVGA